MTFPLDNLCGPTGSLTAEPANAEEFAGLCAAAEESLADARNPGNGLGSRFRLAYAAAHAFSLAALRHKGYRARHRYIVFQVLPHTLGLGTETWRVLALAHDKRNLAEYEGHVEASEQLVVDVLAAVDTVAAHVRALPPIAGKS